MTDYDGLAYLKSSTLAENLYNKAERMRVYLQRSIDILSPEHPFTVTYRNAQYGDWQYKFLTTLCDGREYIRFSPCIDFTQKTGIHECVRISKSILGLFRLDQYLEDKEQHGVKK